MRRIKEKIHKYLSDEARRPVSVKELSRALGIRKEERGGLKKTVNEMVSDGTLIKIRGGRYALPSKMNLVRGRLTCHPDGFGFVIPEDEGDDVFINPRKLGGAMHGDTVVSRIEPSRRPKPGKREGRIIRVVKRARSSVVGRYKKEKGFGVVLPSDEKILRKVSIPPRDRNGAEDGMIVEAEITRWPTKDSEPAGRVVEVLGDPENPDVEAEVILKKYGLASRFPSQVTNEVRKVPMKVSEADIKGRVDLRDKTTFTIDGETARDFDDAVSIDKTRRGWRLRVSIADVSHYVAPATALDMEAYERGTSVYFPDRCIPMLPEELSNGICSLNPGEDRLTLTAEMEFDTRGETTRARVYESVIKSHERLTYTKVKHLLEGPDPELEKRYSHVIPDLRQMRELAEKLMEKRAREGSIDFDLPEPQIIIDLEGQIEDIVRSERNIAHRIIEEFMLAANRSIAERFSNKDLPFLYRVHDKPDSESLADFVEFAAGFGIYFKSGGGPKAFRKVLERVEGRPEERLINHVLLRSMKQAVYSAENIGHFGLAFDDYTHFTSPIRRYPDLVVHRLVKKLISRRYGKKEQDRVAGELPEVAAQTSSKERTAMEAEREIADLKKAQFMKDKEGEDFEGFISGVTSFGLFVELKEYFVEGLVHVSTLGDDYYVYEEKKHTLTGEHTKKTFRLADPVKVKVASVDLERRRIDLLLVEGGAERPEKGGKKKKKKRRGKTGKRG